MKDTVCPNFLSGLCTYGTSCKMKHVSNSPATLIVAPPAGGGPNAASANLVVVTCRDCNSKFETNETWWLEKSLTLPKACKSCRDKKRAANREGFGVCVMDCAFPVDDY